MLLPSLVFGGEGVVERGRGESAVRSRDATLDAADDEGYDGYVEGGEFDTEGVAVGLQGGFGGVVD
jgi:hypothetical protein